MVASAAAASCLVSPTPTDIQPAQVTPPYLSALSPDAFKIWIISRISGAASGPATFEPKYISFNVVSEDLGSNLYAVLVLDKSSTSPGVLLTDTPVIIPPGHVDDPKPRRPEPISFTIPAGTPAGCHSLTLIVTHQFVTFRPIPAQDWDAAYAVWWLDVDDDTAAPKANLSRCAAEYPHASDAGTDGSPSGAP
jgi:hypothetical protein